ncbi:MAG: hypothetical protein R2771_11065 [Saprospiraceae bacterium]
MPIFITMVGFVSTIYGKSKTVQNQSLRGKKKPIDYLYQSQSGIDYGNMNWYKSFKGTHPKVMKSSFQIDWADKLHFEKNHKVTRKKLKHEKLKMRF